MDARTIYSLLKPHLDLMEPSEKKSLSNLISGNKEGKKRKTISLSRAKEKIRKFTRTEIEKEKRLI